MGKQTEWVQLHCFCGRHGPEAQEGSKVRAVCKRCGKMTEYTVRVDGVTRRLITSDRAAQRPALHLQ